MSKNIEVSVDLLREGVQIGVEAAALCEKVASDQAAVKSKIPLIVDTLIDVGMVDSLDKQATADLLRDPSEAMNVIAKLAGYLRRPRSMGAAEKPASHRQEDYDPRNPPERESDRVFRETLLAGQM